MVARIESGRGITNYQVDASNFDPVALKTNRKRTDAAYKGWLTQQVQEAIDAPQPSVPHREVAAEWATERAALLKQAEGLGSL